MQSTLNLGPVLNMPKLNLEQTKSILQHDNGTKYCCVWADDNNK